MRETKRDKLDINKIHPMDCRDGLEKMEKESVDVVVTSPPYNIGKDYSKYDDDRPMDEYLSFLREVARKVRDVMKEDGSFFFNIGGKPSNPWIPMKVAVEVFEKEDFVMQNDIHWIKSIAIEKKDVGDYDKIKGDIAAGHYQPVNSSKYLNRAHEYIFHFTKGGNVELDLLGIGVKYQDKSNISRWDNPKEDLRDRGNTWFIPYETIRSSEKERPHPTTFPVKLPEMCIKVHGVEKTELVLDPFMGIGSTALASKKLGVDYIGFEIDEGYIDVAEERLQNMQSKLGDF